MAKLKIPLLSLDARGRLTKLFAFTKRRSQNIIEQTPIPSDAKSPAQLFNRHMFTKCKNLWSTLNRAEQLEWESLARRRHMSGYAWFISQCLKPNPGIYLPLQGGTMQGDIDMDSFRLLNLIDPTLDQEPVTKKYFEDNVPPGAGDFPLKMKPALVRWVLPGWYAAAGTNLQIIADWIFYIPIFVEETTTYIRIGITVATSSPGTADLRIFNWTAGLPSSLILAAGTINTDTTGFKEIVISQTLTRGYYFLAIRCTGTPYLTMLGNTSAISAPVAGISPLPIHPQNIILAVIAPYADPAPAPTMALPNEFACVFLREN